MLVPTIPTTPNLLVRQMAMGQTLLDLVTAATVYGWWLATEMPAHSGLSDALSEHDGPARGGRHHDYDGIGDYVRIPNAAPENTAWDFGSSDFRIEFDFKTPAAWPAATNEYFFGFGRHTRGITMHLDGPARRIEIYVADGSSWFINSPPVTPALELDTWYRMAFERQGNDWTFTVNGLVTWSSTHANSVAHVATPYVNLGCYTDDGGSFFGGGLHDVRLYKAGALTARWLLEEESGTTAYNTVDAALNGTIISADLGALHAADQRLPRSVVDDEGYTLSGSVVVPRGEADPSLDALGNPIQYQGRAGVTLGLVGSPCVHPDGAGDYGNAGEHPELDLPGSKTVFARCVQDTHNGNANIISDYNTAGSLTQKTLGWVDGSVRWVQHYTDGSVGIFYSTASVSAGQEVAVCVVVDNTAKSVKIYLDGLLDSTHSYTKTIRAQTGYVALFRSGDWGGSGDNFDGKAFDLGITNAAATPAQVLDWAQNHIAFPSRVAHWPCVEGKGRIIHEVVNGFHATMTTADPTALWASKQDTYHTSLVDGYSRARYMTGAGTATIAHSADTNSGSGSFTILLFLPEFHGSAAYQCVIGNGKARTYFSAYKGWCLGYEGGSGFDAGVSDGTNGIWLRAVNYDRAPLVVELSVDRVAEVAYLLVDGVQVDAESIVALGDIDRNEGLVIGNGNANFVGFFRHAVCITGVLSPAERAAYLAALDYEGPTERWRVAYDGQAWITANQLGDMATVVEGAGFGAHYEVPASGSQDAQGRLRNQASGAWHNGASTQIFVMNHPRTQLARAAIVAAGEDPDALAYPMLTNYDDADALLVDVRTPHQHTDLLAPRSDIVTSTLASIKSLIS